MLRFPDGFFWGAATAAHQIEGNNLHSDWWRSEQAGLLPYKSLDACCSWTDWREDIRLLKDLGLNAYRLSVEWARIEPEPGRFDRPALQNYRDQLQALKDNNIEPMVTLHHFTSPAWLADRGGLADPGVVDSFTNYVSEVNASLGDLVTWWITFNEPSILGYKAYIEGSWPPHRPNHFRGYTRLMRHARKAHARARSILKAGNPRAMVSMAFAIWPLQALRAWSPIDQAMALLGDWLWQGRIIKRSLPLLDWIGVNYYSRTFVGWPWPSTPNGHVSGPLTDFGWEVYPEGLRQVLNRVGRFGKPVIITENGIADASDRQRADYIVAHVRQMLLALHDGVDLRGYMHWTLLDNFEWAEGFEQRFGLATRERQLRPSGRVYERIAGANALPDELLGSFSVT